MDTDTFDRSTMHKHYCEACGCVWAHDNAVRDADRRTLVRAHTCPACGSHGDSNYDVYDGGEAPLPVNHHRNGG
jgi:predicted RNA-binding Zn-ribbon protein involved in translation (DUF1610 family)